MKELMMNALYGLGFLVIVLLCIIAIIVMIMVVICAYEFFKEKADERRKSKERKKLFDEIRKHSQDKAFKDSKGHLAFKDDESTIKEGEE